MPGYYNSEQPKEEKVDLNEVPNQVVKEQDLPPDLKEKPKQQLGDFSNMPFGKHKGKAMKDVPVDWLHWFWEKCVPANHQAGKMVEDYIRRNINVLKEENKDWIWTRK